MNKLPLPNILSGSRLALAPLAFYLIDSLMWRAAAIVVLIAVLTDLLDGYLARRLQLESHWGGLLDHSSDALFVTVTLAALATQNLVPWVLPCIVIGAFLQYVLDSKAIQGQSLRASLLGRYNGIAYFVLAGWPVMQNGLNLHPVDDHWFLWASWALIASTSVSMLDRLVALRRARSGAHA
ncbi:MAG: CDP-alcohol phosphatidyltransferase family protein [SAR86 cluster bacterium]|jgi:cardiolipin synthase (CMP-forming)|tara:strand:+ start:1661 stop:2203 length:543 start_codon:yes stop_codon:yes gene_type:complete